MTKLTAQKLHYLEEENLFIIAKSVKSMFLLKINIIEKGMEEKNHERL